MSLMSESLGYVEACGKSHEFLRRGCTKTPTKTSWAGDLLITEEVVVKQSEVNDMRGEESDVSHTYAPITEECPEKKVGIPSQYKVEETSIRSGKGTFNYLIPKAKNEEDETHWDLDIYQSLSDCGVLMDGGDALQQPSIMGYVTSLCGTVDRAGLSPKAHYLDNRASYSDDPYNGLLVAIRTGLVWNWEVRYAPKEMVHSEGLMRSDDVTAQFMEQIILLGMTSEDIFEFGMI